ncbi:MAG: hypothetical protein JW761_15685 [Prolixibacteraceae bacterium]|nr:hypothetical protein [Prolixibacteraceae bacterium]
MNTKRKDCRERAKAGWVLTTKQAMRSQKRITCPAQIPCLPTKDDGKNGKPSGAAICNRRFFDARLKITGSLMRD